MFHFVMNPFFSIPKLCYPQALPLFPQPETWNKLGIFNHLLLYAFVVRGVKIKRRRKLLHFETVLKPETTKK